MNRNGTQFRVNFIDQGGDKNSVEFFFFSTCLDLLRDWKHALSWSIVRLSDGVVLAQSKSCQAI